MKEEGVEAWPSFKPVANTTKQCLADFMQDADETKEYTLAGRLMSKRDHGKTFFCNLQDYTGSVQLYLKQADLGEELFNHFKHHLDIGDIVWVSGALFKTKMGEITLHCKTITLLSKCLHPLPEKYHGLTDVKHRYRQRYLDLMSSEDVREKFKKRSGILQAIRNFLQNLNFIEVETPMLHPIPGGAAAKPFVTHHNAYDMELFLRIAPEFYLKNTSIS